MKDFKISRTGRLSPAMLPPLLPVLALLLACGTPQGSAREPLDKTPAGEAGEAAAAGEQDADAQADPAIEATWQGDGEGGGSGPADGVQAASQPDGQDAAPEDAIHETTLEALRQGSEAPGFVNVKAYFVATINPSPCPPKHLCEPCTTVTIISDNPAVKDADSKEGILVEGYPPSPGKMEHGKLYAFTLELGEDYEKYIDVKECDPRIIKVWLYDCVDCPKKGKGKGKGEGKGKMKKHIELEF